MEPHEFVEAEFKIINQLFSKEQGLYPMVTLIKNNERFQVPVAYQNTAHKDIIAQGIMDLVKKSEPDVVVYLAETWTKMIRTAKDRLSTSALATIDTEKTEILLVRIEFRTGEKFNYECKIVTEIINSVIHRRLDKFKYVESFTSLERFCDFFPVKRYH